VRDVVLPCALLGVALGVALARSPGRTRMAGVLTFVTVTACMARMPIATRWQDIAFSGCWASVIVNAATTHLPWQSSARCAIALSLIAGGWAGALMASSGSAPVSLGSLCCVMVVVPAVYLVDKRAAIVVKVISSWLIAVACLAVVLQLLQVTPGYLPDHLD
jgi:hypothetical protein